MLTSKKCGDLEGDVSRSIAKTGVNISLILLRLKDRENAVNDRK